MKTPYPINRPRRPEPIIKPWVMSQAGMLLAGGFIFAWFFTTLCMELHHFLHP